MVQKILALFVGKQISQLLALFVLISAAAVSVASGQMKAQVDPVVQEQWGPTLAVSVNNPLYVYCHFRDDDQVDMRLSYSRVDFSFIPVNPAGSFAATALRDTSCLYVPDADPTRAGVFYFIATPSSGVGIQFFSSTDLVHFSGITIINMATYVPGAQTAWAPEWWHDPNTGNYYFWVSVGTVPYGYNTSKTPYLVQFDPARGLVAGTPAAITLSGTTQCNTFDYFPYFLNGTYYIVYVDQQSDPMVSQPIAYATAASLSGPYTQQTVDGVDYFGLGTFQAEAPTLIELGQTGCVRMVFDTWIVAASGARQYSPVYRDSCASEGGLFSQASMASGPRPLTTDPSEHGTIMALTDNPSSAVVLDAASQFAAHQHPQR